MATVNTAFTVTTTQTRPYLTYCRGCDGAPKPCLPPPPPPPNPPPGPNNTQLGGTLYTVFSGGAQPPTATIPGGSWRYNQTQSGCTEYNGKGDDSCVTFPVSEVHALCSRVDPSVCQAPSGSPYTDPVTGLKTVNAYFNPIQPDTLVGPGDSAQVSCDYDASWFITAADVSIFQEQFVNTPNFAANQNTLLYNFCSRQVPTAAATDPTNQSCPIDPATSLPMPACSYFVAQGSYNDAGNICRTWESQFPVGASQVAFGPDASKKKYCTDSSLPIQNTPDCSCINRITNQTFQALTGGGGGSAGLLIAEPGCWFIPCTEATSTFYLTLENGVDGPPISGADCQTVCASVINIYKNNAGTITVNDASSISCGNLPPAPGPNPDVPPSPGPWNITPLMIFLIIGAIVVIIIIVILVIYLGRRKRSVEDKTATE